MIHLIYKWLKKCRFLTVGFEAFHAGLVDELEHVTLVSLKPSRGHARHTRALALQQQHRTYSVSLDDEIAT